MIIEDPEAFKAWLTTRLEPLCDADPAALAKYVYALVKKDKPLDELRSSMIGQLEVFLQRETQGFVDILFKTLETQKYDNGEPPSGGPAPPQASAPASAPPSGGGSTKGGPATLPSTATVADIDARESTVVSSSNGEPEKKVTKEPTAAILASAQNSSSLGSALLATATGRKESEKHSRKYDSDKDERDRGGRGGRGGRGRRGSSETPERRGGRDHGRSPRSRSPLPGGGDRRRSRSRERDRARAWRNKSPPSRGRYDRDRRHSHSKSPLPSRSRYSKSRSPVASRDRRTRYRNRSPPLRSRTRSRSPLLSKYSSDLRDRKEDRLSPRDRDQPPLLGHLDTELRVGGPPPPSSAVLSGGGGGGLQSVVSLPPPPGVEGQQPLYSTGPRRCRDFDGKSSLDLELRVGGPPPPSSAVLSGGGGGGLQSVVSLPPPPGVEGQQPLYSTGPRRCRDFDEKGYCMRGDLCMFDHGSDPVILEDIDPLYNGGGGGSGAVGGGVVGPGVSVPPGGGGGLLMGHHGQPTSLPNLSVPPPVITPLVTNNMSEYNPDAPSMEPRMWTRPQFRTGPMMRSMSRQHMGRGFSHQQRELINVVTGAPPLFRANRPPGGTGQDLGANNHMSRHGVMKTGGLHRGLGVRPPLPQHLAGNTSLQLKKVPPGVNDITLLNNHFAKFGKIVNIQVCFEGDPESALITFATHTEANIAYKSTEAVLNNRFIRVFWYNPSNNNENKGKNLQNVVASGKTGGAVRAVSPSAPAATGGITTTKTSALERLGAPPVKVLHNIQPSALLQHHEQKVTVVNNNVSKTLYIPSAMKKEVTVPNLQTTVINNPAKEAAQENLKKKLEEVALAKKKQEEARKAGLKLNADLRKRKQELLEKQINQQKVLIQRIEAGGVPEGTKASLMATIKELQGSIEKIRKDLENSVKANLTTASKKVLLTKEQAALYRKTKEEITESKPEDPTSADEFQKTQKELLDAELDLLQSQHEGKDVTELRLKVIELKKKAAQFGLPASATRGGTVFRGRPVALALRPRGRGRGGLLRGGGMRYLASTGPSILGSLASDPHNVVDRRPTNILVSGYELDDKEEVIKHFEVFGEIEDYISDDATPSLVLNYKSRKDAEKAILKGRNFHDRLLSVTWATPNTSIRGGIPSKPPTPSHRQVLLIEEEENIEEVIEDVDEEDEAGILSPDILIHDDEDEEDEERSWRR